MSEDTAGRWNRPGQLQLKEDGKIGDCWRCCIAAILQVDPAAVPHFVEIHSHRAPHATAKWLRDHGYWLVEVQNAKSPEWDCPDEQGIPVIACGPSPRSTNMTQHHAVVMLNGSMVYDPHPSKAGLTAIVREYLVVPQLSYQKL